LVHRLTRKRCKPCAMLRTSARALQTLLGNCKDGICVAPAHSKSRLPSLHSGELKLERAVTSRPFAIPVLRNHLWPACFHQVPPEFRRFARSRSDHRSLPSTNAIWCSPIGNETASRWEIMGDTSRLAYRDLASDLTRRRQSLPRSRSIERNTSLCPTRKCFKGKKHS
jgi:hypothetical protein